MRNLIIFRAITVENIYSFDFLRGEQLPKISIILSTYNFGIIFAKIKSGVPS
jgi:hypothetical protein